MHATTKEAENNDDNSIIYAYLVDSGIRTYVYDPPFTIFVYHSIYTVTYVIQLLMGSNNNIIMH